MRDLLAGEIIRPIEAHHLDHPGSHFVASLRPDEEVRQARPCLVSISNTGFFISNSASGNSFLNIQSVVSSVPKAWRSKSESTGTGRWTDAIGCAQPRTHSYPRRQVVSATTPKNRQGRDTGHPPIIGILIGETTSSSPYLLVAGRDLSPTLSTSDDAIAETVSVNEFTFTAGGEHFV